MILVEAGCVGCFCVSLMPSFNTPAKRKLRALVFIFTGAGSAFPLLNYYFFRDINYTPEIDAYLYMVGGLIYIVGAIIYASRFPEKQWPGKFNFIVSFGVLT